MEAFRQIHRARSVQRVHDRGRPPADARVHGPLPAARRLAVAEIVGDFPELARDAFEVTRRQPGVELLAALGPLTTDRRGDAPQRLWIATAGRLQLLHQIREDVELAHGAKLDRNLLQPAAEAVGQLSLELKHRQDFAQPARRHARPMERVCVALAERL